MTVSDVDAMKWARWLLGIAVAIAALSVALGRIPFDIPMPTHAIGVVSPTCGLTRGTIATLRGNFSLAVRYNPLSVFVPFIAVAFGIRIIVGLLRRNSWVNVRFRPTKAAWVAGAIVIIGLWIYQQSNAAFLMHSHGV